MPTPRRRIRSLVSLVAVLAVGPTAGACASAAAASRAAQSGPAPARAPSLYMPFDNDGKDNVHVYLVSERRQWLLGRVERGAHTTLRIPEDALTEQPGWLRLVVLAGDRVTQRAAAQPGAATATPQPAAEFLSQRWTFKQSLGGGQLLPVQLRRAAGERASREPTRQP